MSTLQESYTGTPSDAGYATSSIFRCQSWTTVNGYDIYSVILTCRRVGTCGTATVEIYANSSDLPTDGVLATSTVDCSAWSTSYAEHEFVFSTPYTLPATTKYVMVMKTNGANSTNCIEFGRITPGLYTSGTAGYYVGGWAVDPGGRDYLFKTYSNVAEEYIDITGTLETSCSISGTLGVFDVIDLTGTLVASATITGTLSLASIIGLTGTLTVSASIAGTLTISSNWQTENFKTTKRIIAVGNDSLYFEDI